MRAIIIIKQKQIANTTTTETKKPVEPSTRKIANTVKSWIEESQQHRRNLPRSLSALCVLILIAVTIVTTQSPASTSDKTRTPAEQAIKVTIVTTGGFRGSPATRYKVGQEIPVTI